MDISYYLGADEAELPLQNILEGGGFTGIFRSIGCIGDSLSSGEFETRSEDGSVGFHDLYEYSWGQYIARDTGAVVYNFSKGGMTARQYMDTFADENGFWDEDKKCQSYIIALGANDIFMEKTELGTTADINLNDFAKNKKTFAGYYGAIIQKLRLLQPHAPVFLMTMPRHEYTPEDLKAAHAALIHEIAGLFDNIYVLDFYKYAPVYDGKFWERYFLHGHMNAAGYLLTARMVESYIDYIIRHNPQSFAKAGLIGTPYYDEDSHS